MKIRDLRRKAARGTLEVEHLLEAARTRLPNLSDELRKLAVEFGWKHAHECSDAAPYVPLATWSRVSSAYADGGLCELRKLGEEYPTFCIALLEVVKSLEAVEALLSWWPDAMSAPEHQPIVAWEIASALNLILSFKGAPSISEPIAECVRQFAYRLYGVAGTEPDRATAILMLRGVGDERSLAFVSEAANFTDEWAITKPSALSAIRRRVGANKTMQPTR